MLRLDGGRVQHRLLRDLPRSVSESASKRAHSTGWRPISRLCRRARVWKCGGVPAAFSGGSRLCAGTEPRWIAAFHRKRPSIG